VELKDLNDNERLALVALIEAILESDAAVSDAELDQLDAVVDEIGDELYEDTAEAVSERFQSEESLREFLPEITRQDARELIYGTVLETALSDSLDSHEGGLLGWLAQIWGIDISAEAPDGA